ncbi:MAG: electron transfer flavoprotein subunit alpha/FixB family protein [Bacteroidetes bacterium]|nr:electron transfer flavoprotein subunit alpha/FixB family protein [Bacteroidota bacterium]MBS1975882.1 electron transfer flavoprotein subunit alpha/FixB family protein [Bacteroidota bacterium]
MSNNVYVVAEHIKGRFDDITFEMLGKGKEIAGALGGEVVAVLAGSGVKGMASQLGTASKVICIESEALQQFSPLAYAKAVSAVVGAHQPAIVLTGYTSMGMEIGPAVSVDLNIPLVSFVGSLSVDGGKAVAVSQLYGGKMNVESHADGNQCIISILPGAFPADAGRSSGSPAVEDFAAPDLSGLAVTFKKLIEPEGGDVDITTQDILVSAGRGIQSDENLPIVEELAKKIGGAVSCSRPLVDSKWMPKTRQVGKSGLKVKPKLYLALGISGAPEHIEGMKDAGLIIAVNSDPKAPIFDYAHYGVVGDLFEIIPALTGKL